MNLKDDTVNMNGVLAPILWAMSKIEPIMLPYGPFVCASAKDGKHSKNSLHYVGLAFDMRTWGLTDQETRDMVVIKIKETLGSDYDVIDEGDHFHCEVSDIWLARNGDPRKG